MLINMSKVDSLSMDTFKLLQNQKFQGIHVYDPITFTVENFICGDSTDANY